MKSCTIFATILFACLTARALDPAAVTNAANDLLANALGAEQACSEFVTGAVEHNEWTPEAGIGEKKDSRSGGRIASRFQDGGGGGD